MHLDISNTMMSFAKLFRLGIVGIAGAVDFFDRYLNRFFNKEQREKIALGEVVWNDGPFGSYAGTRKYVTESQPLKLLNKQGKQ